MLDRYPTGIVSNLLIKLGWTAYNTKSNHIVVPEKVHVGRHSAVDPSAVEEESHDGKRGCRRYEHGQVSGLGIVGFVGRSLAGNKRLKDHHDR
jgi:hypothetical protein